VRGWSRLDPETIDSDVISVVLNHCPDSIGNRRVVYI